MPSPELDTASHLQQQVVAFPRADDAFEIAELVILDLLEGVAEVLAQ
jgi:hypothetical protein